MAKCVDNVEKQRIMVFKIPISTPFFVTAKARNGEIAK